MRPDDEVQAMRTLLQWNSENITMTAKMSGMGRNTVRKYRQGELPSEKQTQRKPREGQPTRPSPFTPEHEAELKRRWEADPQLQANTLLDELLAKYPDPVYKYHAGLLRTLQRRLDSWRLAKQNFRPTSFPQEWRPGRAMQLDWTRTGELAVTIGGQPFEHLFCHVTLPYSNWSCATLCYSESLLSLKHGLQEACWQAGGLAEVSQTDNSSAATHRIGKKAPGKASPPGSAEAAKRAFNDAYLKFTSELGVLPESTPVRCPNANADIESGNGHFKKRLDQALRLRGSRDFADVAAYQAFFEAVIAARNLLHRERFAEEKTYLRPLPKNRLPVYDVQHVKVSRESLIHLGKNLYSMPSRLIGEILTLWIYEDRIRVFRPGKGEIAPLPHLRGEGRKLIDFRHLIAPLRRKPGAFRGYVHFLEFFPGSQFRRAFDRLGSRHAERQAERIYLDILQLAADHGTLRVDAALQDILLDGREISRENLGEVLGLKPCLGLEIEMNPDLSKYDLHIPGAERLAPPSPAKNQEAGS
jgi:hypothetical protein